MPQGLRLVPLSTVLALLALILLGSLLSAACFWGEDPTRPPDPTPTATATTAPETEPTRPPERTPTPTATAAPETVPTRTPERTPTPTATAAPETDKEALVALYNSTDGPNWSRNDNWLSDAPVGEWAGVNTGNNGRVIELRLRENQLSGEIPPELGNLANLAGLGLSRNQLSGCLPEELRDVEYRGPFLPFC